MPNWCEGTLKVRGNFENVRNFILNGLSSTYDDLINDEIQKSFLDIWNDDEEYFKAEIERTCYLDGTRRGFIDDSYVYLNKKDEYGVLLLNARFAWCIFPEELQKICKEYGVDMKITAFERGAEFVQELEIVNGEIIQSKEIEYDDYRWDCPCPLLGG